MNMYAYLLRCNVPLFSLFQSCLDRIQVALNNLHFPWIVNTFTVLFCSCCPVLQAKNVKRIKSGVPSTRLKLLLDNIQLLLCVPDLFFLFKKFFGPVLLLILGGESLFGRLGDLSLKPGVE
jgi:hypothetical protein